MRIKILLLGNDPVSLMSDGQLLRERGLLVFTAFNLQNIYEIINEINPDVVFFDSQKPNILLTDTYNDLVNNISSANVPVIFTLSDDTIYLVTRKWTDNKDKRTIIADNIIDAIKVALRSNKPFHKPVHKINHSTIALSNLSTRA